MLSKLYNLTVLVVFLLGLYAQDAYAQAVLADSFKESTAGLTSIEAENYHRNITPPAGTPKWDRVTTASQSGTGSMKANPNSGVSNDTAYTSASPRLDYKIKFVKTGTHYVWVRAIGATAADDSVHAGLNGQALTTSDKITGFTASWTWSKITADASAAATVNVAAAGEHTLNLWMREDGIVIDKIVVTTSSTYTPSGTGPAESAQVAPAAPVLNSAVAGDKKVTLSWSGVSGAAGYKVYRGLTSRSYGATATDVGPAKTYTAGNLTNGTKYYFAVVAYNSAGQSIYSNELSTTPVSSLAAPVLNSAAAGDGQVSLSWSAVTGTTGYRIYYKSGTGSYGTVPAVEAGGATSFTVTGLTNGTAYSFVVVAYAVIPGSPESVSAYSNERSATPVVPPPPAPALGAATAGNAQASLSWSAAAGAAGYKVYYSTTSGQYAVIPPVNVGGDMTSATVTGLTNGTTYYFTVTAYNAGGEGQRSNELSATPVAPPPTVTLTADPVVLTAGGSTTLTWSSTNADSCSASGGWIGDKPLQGTASVTPALTSTYTITCTGPGGSASAGVEVTVNPVVVADTPALYVTNVDYNAAGQMTKIEYGNGIVTTYDYDPLTLRLIHLKTLNPNPYTLIQDLSYTYDSAGNILSITDNAHTATQDFAYDELNRLTQAQGQNYGIKNYQYDEIGNIITKDDRWYSYGEQGAGPHAVTSLSDGTTLAYDANGNMAAKTESGVTTAYTYDAENRLTKVVKNGSTAAQYEYDGDGGRTKKVTAQGTTEFIGSLFEKNGTRNTRFIFLGDQRVASITNGNVLYYHADHLGGTNVLTDATGLKKELIEYEPFGLESRHEKYGSSEEVAWYYFTGKPKDDETGLYYFGARYYDPKLGRFITADTIVPYPTNPQALNRYSYAGNNPVSHLEDGHGWWKKAWKNFVHALRHPFDIEGQWKNLWSEAKDPDNGPIVSGITAFVLSGFNPVVGISAALTSYSLSTPQGQKLTNWVANEIYDDILGFSPRTAYMLAYIDLIMTGTYLSERAFANIIADPAYVRNTPITDEEIAKLRNNSYFAGDEGTFGPSLKTRGAFERNDIKALTKDGEFVGTYQRRTLDVPGLKQLGAQHSSANALAVSGPQLNPLRYATWGVCHQATNMTLLQGGVSSTILTLGPSWDMFVTTAVYGNYGGQLGNRIYTGINSKNNY